MKVLGVVITMFNLNYILILQVRIARIFNTYGPRMCLNDGRVVSNFVSQVKTRSLRAFVFVDLLVRHHFLSGPSQRTHYCLWRWKTNPELSICLRSGMQLGVNISFFSWSISFNFCSLVLGRFMLFSIFVNMCRSYSNK